MNLGDRMKANYENRAKTFLIRRTPVIMRLDGKAFHTLTRGCDKPFDEHLMWVMRTTAKELVQEIQGAKLAYVQSDEISILITDYDKLETDAWFNYNVQKITSISAAIASVRFTSLWRKEAYFDSRVFNLPKEEVNNYFVWRQKDWERNSLFMYANHYFSANELHKKSNADKHEMLHKIGENWAHLEDRKKNGTLIERVITQKDPDVCPLFVENPHIINHHVNCDLTSELE